MKNENWVDILDCIIGSPASYSAVTLTTDQARKEGIKQFVGKEFANHTVINVYKSSEWIGLGRLLETAFVKKN